jgi:predicted nucleotidyltransferase
MLAEGLDVADLGRKFPELRLLVLHGSRARGTHHSGSDWDFGYLADPGLDDLGLRMRLSLALETDDIDLVDLARASSVLRYRAAGEGKPILERSAGEFERFALDAILFWLDVEPVLRKAHAELLERLE